MDIPNLDIISQRHHANSLPYPQSNTGSDTTVETLDAVLLVDEPERVEDGKLGGAVDGC